MRPTPETSVTAPAPGGSGAGARISAFPYLLIAPTALLVGVLVLYPMVRGLLVSLYGGREIVPRPEDYVGLANYLGLLRSREMANALRVTLLYTAGTVSLSLAVGMACALLLSAEFPGRGIARAALTVPWGTPMVASALIWYWMYDPQYGLVNFLLRKTGVLSSNVSWLLSPRWALPAVVLVDVWRIFPFGAVVLLTALTAVDRTLYDAARVDGAGPVATFLRITLPGIRPSLAILTLLFTIWSLKRFDTIWILTQGGPADATNVLAVGIYREAFRNFHTGNAAAIAMIGITLSAMITVGYFLMERRRGASYG
jgi:multiple sugar transport system permease protein